MMDNFASLTLLYNHVVFVSAALKIILESHPDLKEQVKKQMDEYKIGPFRGENTPYHSMEEVLSDIFGSWP